MPITPVFPFAVPGRYVRILRWTFSRDNERVICELGLTSDASAYELRVLPLWNLTRTTTELFDDALSAFQRHGTIERILINEGWSLDHFESDRVVRAAEGIVVDPQLTVQS